MRKIVVLLMLVMGSVAIVMANPGKKATEDLPLKAPEELTKEELKQIYKKYGITENDIKFAKGELPHYLEGTILDGKVATMGKITREGKVEDWVDPLFYNWCLRNGYKVIPATKALEIREKARSEYIKKYGVDPANPKVVIVNGVPLPKEYIKELVLSGKLKYPKTNEDVCISSLGECDI